jgi:hypothetical protein
MNSGTWKPEDKTDKSRVITTGQSRVANKGSGEWRGGWFYLQQTKQKLPAAMTRKWLTDKHKAQITTGDKLATKACPTSIRHIKTTVCLECWALRLRNEPPLQRRGAQIAARLREVDGEVWIGPIWLRIETRGGLFWSINFKFHTKCS